MDTMETLGTIVPALDTPAGAALLAGEVIATLTSKRTDAHVTMRLRPSRHGDDTCRWVDATQLVIEEYDGRRIATYIPGTGEIAWRDEAGSNQKWSARAVLRYLAGQFPELALYATLDITTIDEQLELAA